jgi:O-methyltransferase involved in polyketide biosynthesis
LFNDPLAERLAGQHGRDIVARVPRTMRSGWWLVARTKIVDDTILEAIDDGCDRVLNLVAGLDTRPYRLDLPSEFTWVEGDLPALVAEKERLLADETPRCQLTRHAVDLADPVARDRFLTDGMLQNAPFKFAPANGLGYFEDLGWQAVEVESVFEAARRFHRLPWLCRLAAHLPQPDAHHPPEQRPWSAVVRLTR